MDTVESRRLLRAVDDAKDRLRHYRWVRNGLAAAFTVFATFALGGVAIGFLSASAGVDMGGPASVAIIMGVIGSMVSGGVFMWWWDLHNMSGGNYIGPPRTKIIRAQRELDDHSLDVLEAS